MWPLMEATGGAKVKRGREWLWGWVGWGMGTTPPQSFGWVGGNGNDPNWDSPPREKHEPNPGSPRGGKGEGKHQPPLAGVGGTAGEGGGCW
jgi:hypothetical protein